MDAAMLKLTATTLILAPFSATRVGNSKACGHESHSRRFRVVRRRHRLRRDGGGALTNEPDWVIKANRPTAAPKRHRNDRQRISLYVARRKKLLTIWQDG